MVFAAAVSSSLTQFLLLPSYIAIDFFFIFVLDLHTYKAYGELLRSLQLLLLLAGT